MSDFLLYWRPGTATHETGAVLKHAASNQLKRVQADDRLWVVTTADGELQLLGRIEVAKVVGQRAAERAVGQSLWEADFHALAKAGTEMVTARIPISDIAPKLRFTGKADRLVPIEGRVNGQELQTMRRLQSTSVHLLASKLGLLTETASHLQVGSIYSREDLREMFGIVDATINNGVFPPKGHNSIWLFITESKTPDRTQYVDLLDGDTLYFDGQTEGRTDGDLIDHVADGRDVLVFYRKKKDEYPGGGFVFEGSFCYISHDGSRPTHFIFNRLGHTNGDAVVEIVERLAGRRSGQGISVPPKVRIAIEQYAMNRAVAYFEKKGYVVEDVHARQPVDLIARRKGEVRRIEVKGTQTEGREVLLTHGEVEYARQHKREMVLFILSGLIATEDERGDVAVDGGDVHVRDWDIDAGLLQPLAYRYRLA